MYITSIMFRHIFNVWITVKQYILAHFFLMRPRSRKKKLEMKLIHHGRKNCPFHIHAFRYVYNSVYIRGPEGKINHANFCTAVTNSEFHKC